MIPNFALSVFPAFKDDSVCLPSGADLPVSRPAALATAGVAPGYAFGPEVSLPSFTGFLQAGHLQPLGLRLARVKRP